jgi:hypothetical protein
MGEPEEQVGPPAVDVPVLLPADAIHLLVGQAYGEPRLRLGDVHTLGSRH